MEEKGMKTIAWLFAANIFLWAAGRAVAILPGVREPDIDQSKADKCVYATRAPNASDNGTCWITYTANSDTTLTMYLRHPNTGVWRSEAFN